MLILSRKQMESIQIRDDIVLTVLQIRGNRVRLGIEAPRHVSVHRTEAQETNSGTPGSPHPANSS